VDPGDKLTLPAGRSLRSLPRQEGQPVAAGGVNHLFNRIIGYREEYSGMPFVKISMLEGRDRTYRCELLDGVHSALVEAFQIPDKDRHQQLYELDKDHFEISEGKSDQFVLVEIIAFQGRSLDAKRKLYSAIVRNFGEAPGIPGDDILIILHELPMENWGLRRGKPATEVELGFTVTV